MLNLVVRRWRRSRCLGKYFPIFRIRSVPSRAETVARLAPVAGDTPSSLNEMNWFILYQHHFFHLPYYEKDLFLMELIATGIPTAQCFATHFLKKRNNPRC